MLLRLYSCIFGGFADSWKLSAKYQISFRTKEKTHFPESDNSNNNSEHLLDI